MQVSFIAVNGCEEPDFNPAGRNFAVAGWKKPLFNPTTVS